MAKSQAISSVLLARDSFKSPQCFAPSWFCCSHCISLTVQLKEAFFFKKIKMFPASQHLFSESQRYKDTKETNVVENSEFSNSPSIFLLRNFSGHVVLNQQVSNSFPSQNVFFYFLMDDIHSNSLLTIKLPPPF